MYKCKAEVAKAYLKCEVIMSRQCKIIKIFHSPCEISCVQHSSLWASVVWTLSIFNLVAFRVVNYYPESQSYWGFDQRPETQMSSSKQNFKS